MVPNELLEVQLAREAHERVSERRLRTKEAKSKAAEAAIKADDASARQGRRKADAKAKLVTLRYANGLREHHAGTKELIVGDVLKRDGKAWEVLSVSADSHDTLVVTLGYCERSAADELTAARAARGAS